MTVKKAKPPAGLGTAGKQLWDSVAVQVADDGLLLDARDLRLLRDAARTADDLATIETELKTAPALVAGSTGQMRAQPLLDEARKGRSLIASLLKQMNLSDEAERRAPGVKAGSQARGSALAGRYGNVTGLGGA